MAAELSDAEVFGASKEMTDAQVFGTPRVTPMRGDLGVDPAATRAAGIFAGNAVVAAPGAIGRIDKATGEGFEQGFGNAPLGLGASGEDMLRNLGIISRPGEINLLKALNEGAIRPLIRR